MTYDSLAATYMCRCIEMVNSHKLSSLLASKLFLLGMSKYMHIITPDLCIDPWVDKH